MRIIQLPEAQSIQESDVFAININGADYQVPVSLLVTAMQVLGNYLTEDDLPLPISSGGTGSTSAQAARQALGITPANIAAVATADVANNITTTEAGKVLDARQGAILTPLVLDCGTISSVPTTINDARITADMVAVGADYGTPGSILRGTTANGSVTIYAPTGGSLVGPTTLKLYLSKSRS